jgi:hypothetical protein
VSQRVELEGVVWQRSRLVVANLQMREPRKPLPPQTTIFLAADLDTLDSMCRESLVFTLESGEVAKNVMTGI